MIKNEWMNEWQIFLKHDSQLNFYSTYDKSFVRLQMKHLVFVIINYKSVIFYIMYISL